MSLPIQVALAASAWCFFHSFLITHLWQRWLRRTLPRHHLLWRAVYVAGSSVSLLVGALWVLSLPERMIWEWTGAWRILRWTGIGGALLLLWLGARAHDGRRFLGLRQLARWRRGATDDDDDEPLSTAGILGRVRHPWYTATLILLVVGWPITDVNLAWRTVFFLYTLLGAELEERKLTNELGVSYSRYRERVPRFLPRIRPPR